MSKDMMKYKKYIFEDEPFDGGEYCDFDAAAAIIAGKDILLGVWNADGSKLLAISGQQSLEINREAETIEVNSKSTEGGWADSLAGMKSWDISVDGIWAPNEDSHKAMAAAFRDSEPVCVKVYNQKAKKGLFGGLAIITSYPVTADYDDAATFTVEMQGKGPLVDFSIDPPESDTMPEDEDENEGGGGNG